MLSENPEILIYELINLSLHSFNHLLNINLLKNSYIFNIIMESLYWNLYL